MTTPTRVIRLTDREIREADDIAEAHNTAHRLQHHPDRIYTWSSTGADRASTRACMAVARAYDVAWPPEDWVPGQDGLHTVGGYTVRTTYYPFGGLVIRDRDDDEDELILVQPRYPHLRDYKLYPPLRAKDGKHPKYAKKDDKDGRWWLVPALAVKHRRWLVHA